LLVALMPRLLGRHHVADFLYHFPTRSRLFAALPDPTAVTPPTF
jgi:hypothetical protein